MRVGVRALMILVAGWAALFGAVAARVAHADPLSKPTLPEARSHLALGNKLYNVRSFEEAAAEYKAGTLVEPAPVFDYNLGQCYRLIGKYQEAIWHYERFLTRGKPKGKLLDGVNGFITQMKSELDKKAMTLKPTEPAPAPVASPVGQPPLPQPSPEQPSPKQPGPEQPGPEQPGVRGTAAWYDDKLGWGLSGAGVVGVVAGAGFVINASSLRAEANATKVQDQYHRLSDKASSRSLLGTISGIGGAALLVTGIIKLAVHSKDPARVAAWNIEVSENGMSFLGRF